MRILAIVQGVYGERIVDNIKKRLPEGWQITGWTPPSINEPVVDNPREYLPEKLRKADMILHLANTNQAAQLL